jgi:hypothetical protein
MESWTAACVASTGCSNTWTAGGETYLYEVSRKEHDDGAITGSILKKVPPPAPLKVVICPTEVERILGLASADSFFARKVATFRIEGDGTVTRAPAFLKAASAAAKAA